MSNTTTRRTQRERREATRRKLLDATIALVVEVGYARTTTNAVADRAGVSRGAELYHFPSKSELVLAAVEHLAIQRAEELRELAHAVASGEGRDVAAALDLFWSSTSGPLWTAAAELWVAARTDPELHGQLYPVERRIGHEVMALFRESFGLDPNDHSVDDIVEMTWHFLRGMALERFLKADDARRRELLSQWEEIIGPLLRSRLG